MSEQKLSDDDQIKMNPCGICRGKKLKSCKCKGGGGGGDAEENDDELEQEDELTLQNQPSAEEILALDAFLEESADWQNTDDNRFEFNAFSDDNFLQSIELDLGKCILKIQLKPREDLDSAQVKESAAYMNAIKAFIQQQAEGDGLKIQIKNGSLEISGFRNMEQFDSLMTKLLANNYLPQSAQDQTLAAKLESQVQDEPAQQKSWAPNPFDISRGPTPPGEQ